MEEIVKHINDTNASFRTIGAGDAKNTDLFLDNDHYELFRDAGEQITVRYNKENLQKAILFIASILPRKYDNSAIHRTEPFSSTFVYDQLAFLDAFFTVNGNKVESRTQVWNPRKDIMKKNGEIDNRFYFNGLMEKVGYTNYKGEQKVANFTIRNYLAGGYSDLHIRKAENAIFDVWVTNTFEYKDDGKERQHEEVDTSTSEPLQQIFYGAPGTGKSFTINRDTKKEDVIRTTFHPDTDYSSFVGAYKPTMKEIEKRQPILDYDALVDKLKEYIILQQQNITKACTMFGFDFHDSIVEMLESPSHTLVQLVADGYKSGTTYDTQIRAGMSVYESGKNETESEQIVYRFGFQSFLQAYIKAWEKIAKAGKGKAKKQFLVIEEINRGNCAQIFGDIFQLLDRNDAGYSDYPIKADDDMKIQLGRVFKGLSIEDKETINAYYDGRDVVSEVLKGDILLLPNNLYIWATMNTSDQSLFPIDSAFKRRWNWRYIPISNRKEGYKIAVNGNYYDWWEFLEAINARIWDANHSEDKKLGYFFAKADGDKIINSDLFVGKVIFYLWNDVFKDFIDESDIFNDEDGSKLSFDKFYETLPSGETKVVEKKAEQFLKNLKLEPKEHIIPSFYGDTTFGKSAHLQVTFPNGTKIEYDKNGETLVKFVELVTPERIAEHKIMASYSQNRELLQTQNNDEYQTKSVGDGYYVITKLGIEVIFARIVQISEELELDCNVKIIYPEDN